MKVKNLIPKELHDFIPMVFSECPIGTLSTRKPYDHAVDLKPDFKPVIQKPFHLDQKQNEAVQTFIQENLDKGFIRPSHSSQTSTLFFVPKEDGKPCPVQDYHYLNSQTIHNGYPLPRINELMTIFVNTIALSKWIFVGIITMSIPRKETNGKQHLVVMKDLLNLL